MPDPETLLPVVDSNKSAINIPHIEVKITVGDEAISHCGAQFIDAIKFLADAEAVIRRSSGFGESVDLTVSKIQKENMRKLMESMKNG